MMKSVRGPKHSNWYVCGFSVSNGCMIYCSYYFQSDVQRLDATTDNFEVALYPNRDFGNKARRICLSTLVVVGHCVSPICILIDVPFSGLGAHPEAQIFYLEGNLSR